MATLLVKSKFAVPVERDEVARDWATVFKAMSLGFSIACSAIRFI